jgi:hypothetical protein
MAILISKNSKEIFSDVLKEKFDLNHWVEITQEKMDEIISVQKKYIIFDGDIPREMTSGEKSQYDSEHPEPVEQKSKEEILTSIKGDFTSYEQARRIMRAARKFPDFGWCLDNFDYTGAFYTVVDALDLGDIESIEDANFIARHIPGYEDFTFSGG